MSSVPSPRAHLLPPILTSGRPQAGRPVLIPGPASAAILGADGTFSLPWNTRGAALEWGGVYAQGVRLTGPWAVALGPSDYEVPLGPSTLRRLTHWRWRVETIHEAGDLQVVDEVLPLCDVPGVGRRLTVRRTDQSAGPVRVVADVPLWLAPVLLEGVRPYDFELRTAGETFVARSHAWALAVDSEPLPGALAIDGRPWVGGNWAGEAHTIRLRYDLPLPADRPAVLNWAVWGGLRSTVEADVAAGRRCLERRAGWGEAAAAPWRQWAEGRPVLETPDDPGVSEAFRLAADALRSLYTDPAEEISGLVAGYPWYSALWFRDIGWMLPAVLWLGDVDRVVASLGTAFRHQAPAELSLLGATAGELPMQLSPGPVFLFGTSDTTLYYPGILRRLVDHTGDAELARPYRNGLDRILEWAEGKVDRASGLFTNGGEVAAIKRAATDVGRVHYGIDAYDTTIWDSADRRDHAVDVQVLWQEALDALGDLEELAGGPRSAALHERARAVRSSIVARYAWPKERYLYDSLHRDGTPLPQVRPNALRAVEAGLFDVATARGLVDRAREDDLTTGWGVRTLSSRDPSYDPVAYHEGQVWTIATAWAAGAAFRAGRPEVGVGYLDTIAARIRAEGGYANECYRGDRPEPFDSCFLLGFSVGPFVTTVLEGLWGLRPRLTAKTVECRPCLPNSWKSALLTGIRLGPGRLDLAWRPGGVTAKWDGPWPITLAGERASVHLEPGVPGLLALPSVGSA